ncbi:MAG: AI-2E family transporter [Elusimicrobia bacterium]|nr:AI-2E family transporter [Elusimicrobiota bacterium]
MSLPISGPRKASYALFVLALIGVARFGLGACVLAALVSYMMMDLTERRMRDRGARPRLARLAALAVFAILATALTWIFVAFVRVGVARLPVLLDTVLPRLTFLNDLFGPDITVDNARELRDLVVASAKDNFSSVTKTSGLLTRGFFQVVVGMFVAAMRFLSPAGEEGDSNLFEALRGECSARTTLFVRSFEKVVGAQVAISTINALLTAIFLHAMGFPFKTFLILTAFVCGMVPIVGNVISNAAIVTAGLTVSVQLATIGLIYLVVIHKLEYLLNSRIIGGSIDTPMWMTLLGLVVGEAMMGVPGVLLAPALIHYAREELRAIPAR